MGESELSGRQDIGLESGGGHDLSEADYTITATVANSVARRISIDEVAAEVLCLLPRYRKVPGIVMRTSANPLSLSQAAIEQLRDIDPVTPLTTSALCNRLYPMPSAVCKLPHARCSFSV